MELATVHRPADADAALAYEAIAPHYDDFTSHHKHERWLEDLLAVLKPHGLSGRRLLDVGCGTGKSFVPMLEWGWEVCACDLSPAMVARARDKTGEAARLEVADMRALPRFGEFDLVWALDDAVNYLLSEQELRDALEGMAANLAPGGLLLFDLNTLLTYQTFFVETQAQEHPGRRLVWRGLGRPDTPAGALVEASFEVEAEDGTISAGSVHRQRHFRPEEVREQLREVGLECLEVLGHGLDGVPQKPLDEARHTKAIFIAQLANATHDKGVEDADREARAANSAGSKHSEAELSECSDRAAPKTARSPGEAAAYRLKRSVDPFPASDGSLYLLRSGAEEDFVIRQPSPRDRLVLKLLSESPVSEAGLTAACEQRGLSAAGIAESLSDLERLGLVERAGSEGLLSGGERERYDRQLIYFSDLAESGMRAEEMQQRLAEANVVIVGCGGLGSWTACGLACAGVGSLTLVDDDRVELSNLNRQLLFEEADLGRLKIEAASEALRAHSSELQVREVHRRVRGPDDLTDLLDGAALLIATADWPPYELPRWINRACLDANVPYITAGQFLPLSRIGPMVLPGRSACLECEERRIRREYPLYDELAEFRTANMADAATLGAACGVVGSMLAMEAVHLLSGAIRPASLDTALILDLRTMAVTHEEVERDPQCPACGGVGAGIT